MEKTGRVLNNQQLKYPTRLENRESLNFVLYFLNCVKMEVPCFILFFLEASFVLCLIRCYFPCHGPCYLVVGS